MCICFNEKHRGLANDLRACQIALDDSEYGRLAAVFDLERCAFNLEQCQEGQPPPPIDVFDVSQWAPVVVQRPFIEDSLNSNLTTPTLFAPPLDNGAKLASDENLIDYILWNDVNELRYATDYFDCDDFAWIFRAEFIRDTGCHNCAWILDWSGGHSYCLFVRQNSGLWIYEPQNDQWWASEEHPYEGLYALQNAMILL